MHLNDIAHLAHENAKLKGWWDDERNVPELLALVHSEVSEALEDYRDGRPLNEVLINREGKPVGFPTELADVIIRIADLAGRYGIDLDAAVEAKMRYNATRPHRHGGKRA